MQIIISPAKKMKEDIDSFACRDLPALLPRTRVLLRHLRGLDVPSLRKLLSCNDQIAELNYARFQTMDLERDLTPALLAYGILRPLDGIVPYRLEMQAKLKTDFCASMYDFWGEDLARLLDGEGVLLNLASAEYSRSVLPHLPPGIRVITPIFGERNGAERVVEKGVYVKMARGEMVRFLAEQGTDKPDALTEFDRLGFRCYSELSTPERPVFLRT